MTLHVSLPRELENLVHNEVESGMYGSASEVVREALRYFFSSDNELTPQELSLLREDLKKRRDGIKNGDEHWVDGEDFIARMEQKYK